MDGFTLKIGRFKLEYDTDYGMDHRHGWTTVIDGCVVAELCPLWRTILKTVRYLRIQEDA